MWRRHNAKVIRAWREAKVKEKVKDEQCGRSGKVQTER